MKLQRSISRRIGCREYVKHQVVIPNDVITQVGWNLGDHIEARATAKGILLYKTDLKHPDEKLDYEQFKRTVVNALTTIPSGCSWSELRIKAGLKQKTPSPIWVKQLEEETGMKRLQDGANSRVIWRLPIQQPMSLSVLNSWMRKPQELRESTEEGGEIEKHHGRDS